MRVHAHGRRQRGTQGQTFGAELTGSNDIAVLLMERLDHEALTPGCSARSHA